MQILLPIVVGIFAYFGLKWFLQGPIFRSSKKLEGQTVVVTGANTGIGLETAKDLYGRGARVICLCRNVTKGQKAIDSIKQDSSSNPQTGEILLRVMDLSSMDSIRAAAEKLLQEESRLDILILNAGVMMSPRTPKTADGFDMQMGTNHLGHFLFTRLLIGLLKKTAQDHQQNVRVVTVASSAHMFADGPIRLHDLNWDNEEDFSPGQAYFQSKLANILFSRELGKRLAGTGITTYSLHPGVIATELNRHASESSNIVAFLFHFIFYTVFGGMIKTPVHGAQTTLYCSLEESLKDVTGKYYSDCKEFTPTKYAMDNEHAQELWELSEQLTKTHNLPL
ncbi:hypothetical protein TCAL_07994 [Tigriopus californicus]|uniref:Uncharacterized protein n=1 Tax=Tigriopus californicus TaxID=6832 RepID=A0A553PF00_TIGCA|nr:retinol dehydrogenase 12-like [Tigriopus californicus]TRY76249.1 hypothetical protein TCAL_07994 [Tigriopus californicus]|eukprot:TCALIF_07994-PA protein Name:"Similar to RDH12 Retinol dehydrogenase 12 (Homo sapiens)" AED:0.02 eAED:0.02 QI:0/-1/0/1/-1/1/1/0/336